MQNLLDIIDSQKEKLQELIDNYDVIIEQIEHQEKGVYNYEVLNSLNKINNKIDKIENHFEKIQYNFDLINDNKDSVVQERIKDYQINKFVYDTFTPYMLYLRLILENNYYRNETLNSNSN